MLHASILINLKGAFHHDEDFYYDYYYCNFCLCMQNWSMFPPLQKQTYRKFCSLFHIQEHLSFERWFSWLKWNCAVCLCVMYRFSLMPIFVHPWQMTYWTISIWSSGTMQAYQGKKTSAFGTIRHQVNRGETVHQFFTKLIVVISLISRAPCLWFLEYSVEMYCKPVEIISFFICVKKIRLLTDL